MNKKWWLMLLILIILNMGTWIYILVADVIMIVSNPLGWQQTTTKLGMDAGSMLLSSQSITVNAVDGLVGNGSLGPLERTFLHNQIIGSIAFTFFLVLTIMGIIGFFFKGKESSFWKWFGIFFVSFIIVGVLQVLAAFLVYHQVIYPYQGFISIIQNWEVIGKSFTTAMPINQTIPYSIGG